MLHSPLSKRLPLLRRTPFLATSTAATEWLSEKAGTFSCRDKCLGGECQLRVEKLTFEQMNSVYNFFKFQNLKNVYVCPTGVILSTLSWCLGCKRSLAQCERCPLTFMK